MTTPTSPLWPPPIAAATRRWPVALALALCALWVVGDAAGKGRKPKRRKSIVTFSADYAAAPSYRYANLDAPTCLAELDKRTVSYERVAEARGVLAPVRIPTGVGGVVYRTALPRAKGRVSPWEVFDCRLVLALDDFSQILTAHRIDEVIIFSAWRPPRKGWPKDKLARRHPGALAIDMFKFRQRVDAPKPPAANPTNATPTPGPKGEDEPAEGQPATKAKAPPAEPPTGSATKAAPAKPPRYRWLEVEDHFEGTIGQVTCAAKAGASPPNTPEGIELRALVCEAAAARIFTSMLTPNYDKPHYNHFHFEVTPGVKWRLVR